MRRRSDRAGTRDRRGGTETVYLDNAGEPRDEYEVFISHRSTERDRALAEALCRKLEARGVSTFLDTTQIEGGQSFTRRIIRCIRRARLVIVLFSEELSSWVQFEAGCAFFDEKLLAVSVDGAPVPPPYGRIQVEKVGAITDDCDGADAALDRIVDLAERKLHGNAGDPPRTRLYRKLNRLFFNGLSIVFVVVFPLVLFGISRLWSYDVVNHLHVTLGAVIIGGQFILSLGFARSVASPSFREREFGFEITERLFWLWIVLAAAQPTLGLYLALGPGGTTMTDWVWLSLVLYLMAIIFTVFGYVTAKSARFLDREHKPPHLISRRDFVANVLFVVGFVMSVSVLNVMVARHHLAWG